MITLNIDEKNNILSTKSDNPPIICGNSNYCIKFNFDKDWSQVNGKLLLILINGEKTFVEFSGDTVVLPALPNANLMYLVLISAETESQKLITSSISINLKPTTLTENFPEFKPLNNYVNEIIFKIQSLENGNFEIAKSKYSQIAETAKNVSNQNLLINAGFAVNQRGETTYSSVGKYTVDRWKLVSGSVTTATNGIVLNGTISQTLEHKPNDKVVASVDNSAGGVSCSYSNGIFKITAINKLVKWAKLEVGTTPTQFSPRSYAEELALCQRYCLKLQSKTNYGTICFAVEQTASAYSLFINHSMRVSPSIVSYGGTFNPQYNTSGVTAVTIKDITTNQFSTDYIVLIMNIKESLNFTYGKYINMRSLNDLNTYILLDAEIY